ncbi:MAG: hypothetical protein H7322_19750 [Ramlibacter sp.]|nr:hypothetical protein [Ramlibacter sp.]
MNSHRERRHAGGRLVAAALPRETAGHPRRIHPLGFDRLEGPLAAGVLIDGIQSRLAQAQAIT